MFHFLVVISCASKANNLPLFSLIWNSWKFDNEECSTERNRGKSYIGAMPEEYSS